MIFLIDFKEIQRYTIHDQNFLKQNQISMKFFEFLTLTTQYDELLKYLYVKNVICGLINNKISAIWKYLIELSNSELLIFFFLIIINYSFNYYYKRTEKYNKN